MSVQIKTAFVVEMYGWILHLQILTLMGLRQLFFIF